MLGLLLERVNSRVFPGKKSRFPDVLTVPQVHEVQRERAVHAVGGGLEAQQGEREGELRGICICICGCACICRCGCISICAVAPPLEWDWACGG